MTINELHIRKLKILLADDEPVISIVLGYMLADFYKQIFYVESGIDVVKTFKQNPDIDLVFLDFHMPKMDGLEAAKQIRSIDNNVVIILATADTYTEDLEDAKNYGIDDFYFKPYDKHSLQELIIKHFYRNRF